MSVLERKSSLVPAIAGLGMWFGDAALPISALIVNSGFESIPCGIPGDLDCSTVVSADDISAFVEALTEPTACALNYSHCNLCAADLNGDGLVDGADITAFTRLLLSN